MSLANHIRGFFLPLNGVTTPNWAFIGVDYCLTPSFRRVQCHYVTAHDGFIAHGEGLSLCRAAEEPHSVSLSLRQFFYCSTDERGVPSSQVMPRLYVATEQRRVVSLCVSVGVYNTRTAK